MSRIALVLIFQSLILSADGWTAGTPIEDHGFSSTASPLKKSTTLFDGAHKGLGVILEGDQESVVERFKGSAIFRFLCCRGGDEEPKEDPRTREISRFVKECAQLDQQKGMHTGATENSDLYVEHLQLDTDGTVTRVSALV